MASKKKGVAAVTNRAKRDQTEEEKKVAGKAGTTGRSSSSKKTPGGKSAGGNSTGSKTTSSKTTSSKTTGSGNFGGADLKRQAQGSTTTTPTKPGTSFKETTHRENVERTNEITRDPGQLVSKLWDFMSGKSEPRELTPAVGKSTQDRLANMQETVSKAPATERPEAPVSRKTGPGLLSPIKPRETAGATGSTPKRLDTAMSSLGDDQSAGVLNYIRQAKALEAPERGPSYAEAPEYEGSTRQARDISMAYDVMARHNEAMDPLRLDEGEEIPDWYRRMKVDEYDAKIAEIEATGGDASVERKVRDRYANGEPIMYTQVYDSDVNLYGDTSHDRPDLEQQRHDIGVERADAIANERIALERRYYNDYMGDMERNSARVLEELEADGWEYTTSEWIDDRENMYWDRPILGVYKDAMFGDDLKMYWTKDQMSIYKGLKAAGRDDEAREYERYFNMGAAEERNAEAERNMQNLDLNPVLRTASAIFNQPQKWYSSIDIIGQSAARRLGGNYNWLDYTPINYERGAYGSTIGNTNRQIVSEALAKYGTLNEYLEREWGAGPNALGWVGDHGWDDVYGWGVDVINSRVNAIMAGGIGGTIGLGDKGIGILGGTMMALPAGADTYVEARRNGATESQAGWMMATTVGSEFYSEKIELDGMIAKMARVNDGVFSFKNVIALGFGQMVTGGAQEGVNEIVSQAAENAFLDENSTFERNASAHEARLVALGVNPEDARKYAMRLASDEASAQFIDSVVGGAVSGGGVTVMAGSLYNRYVDNYSYNKAIGNQIKALDNTEVLQEVFSEASGNEVVMPKSAAGTGRVYNKQMAELQKQNQAARDQAVLAYYDRTRGLVGEEATETEIAEARKYSPELDAVRKALVRSAQGRKLTGKQTQLLQVDESARKTLDALREGKITMSEADAARMRGADYAQAATMIPGVKRIRDTIEGKTSTTDAIRAQAEGVAAKLNRSDAEGTTVNGETVKEVNGIKQVANGDQDAVVTVTMEDGSARDVNLSDITFGANANTTVYEYAAVLATPELANQFRYAAQTENVALDQLANGMNTAYSMGLEGYKNIDTVTNNVLTKGLSADTVTAAYNMGVEARDNSLQGKLEKAAQRYAKVTGQEWKPGTVKLDKSIDLESMDDEQRAIVEKNIQAASMIGTLLGMNVEFFESRANAVGDYDAEQGMYIPSTHTIRLDINAGRYTTSDSFTKTAVLRTMSHELTHAMQATMLPQYEQLRSAVLDILQKDKNYNLDREINSRLAFARKIAEERGMETPIKNRDEAIDEIVADACEMMLKDTDALQRLQEMHPEAAKTFIDRVNELFERILDMIKEIFGGEGTKESEAMARALEAEITALRNQWSDMLAEMSTIQMRKIEISPEVQQRIDNEQAISGIDEIKNSIRYDEKYMDAAIKYNAKAGNVDPQVLEEAEKARATVRDFFRDPKNKELLKLPADETGKTFYANSSYSGSMENTTVCIRSMAVQQLMDAVARDLGRPLTVQDTLFISQEVASLKEKPECFYCYVATDRRAYREYLGEYLKQRDDVISKYKAGADKETLYREFLDGRTDTANMKDRFNMWIKAVDNGVELITPKDIASLEDMFREIDGKKKPKVGKLTTSRLNQLQDAAAYAQSASWAKKMVGYAAYNNQILKFSQKRVDGLNDGYGLRMYSFSDYSPAFILENMQMITDAAVRGLNVLAYTKEIDFAKIFAPTGANINISVFAEEVNGQIQDGSMQGAEWKAAQELRKQYPNVGIVMVATNDRIKNWAKEQDWIDVVIPFHLVRTGKQVAEYFGYKDFTPVSGDKKTAAYQKGDPTSISPVEHKNDIVEYADALIRYGLSPRFPDDLNGFEAYKNGDIGPAEFREMNPYYMKLVNETRRSYADTMPVQPRFNVGEAMASIDTMIRQGGYYQPIGGSIEGQNDLAEDIANKIRDDETKYSVRVTEDQAVKMNEQLLDDYYMNAVINGATDEELMVFINEIARRRGYTSGHVYHGTASFGFTKFDPEFSDDKISLFVAENIDIAKSYAADYTKLLPSNTKREYDRQGIIDLKGQKLAEVYNKYNGTHMRPATAEEVVQAMRSDVYELCGPLYGIIEDIRNGYSADSSAYNELNELLHDVDYLFEIPASGPNDFAHGPEISSIVARYNDMIDRGIISRADKKYLDSLTMKLSEKAEQATGSEWYIDDDKPSNGLRYDKQLQYNLFATASGGIYDLYMKYDPNEFYTLDLGRPYDWNKIPAEVIGRTDVGTVTTRDVAAWAKAHGYAGVYYAQIRDSGGQLVREAPSQAEYDMGSDVYVLFDGHYLKSADPVTYDDQNNIIPPSKRFDFDDQDIRFSMRAPVEERGELVALHNLKEENLLRTMHDFGSFPVPSTAIIRAAVGHTGYGEISVVFKKDAIDPSKSRYNEVYSEDAYTVTYGAIGVRNAIDQNAAVSLANNLRELSKQMPKYLAGSKYLGRMLNTLDGIATSHDAETLFKKWHDDTAVKAAYLIDTGKTIDVQYDDMSDNLQYMPKRAPYYQQLIDAYGGDVYRIAEMDEQQLYDENKELFDKVLPIKLADKLLRNVRNFTRQALAYNEAQAEGYKPTLDIDEDETNNAINRQIDEAAYSQWLHAKLDGVISGEKGIRNTRDMYTPGGRPRGFNQLYDPYTLENIVAAMRRKPGREAVAPSWMAAATKQYANLDEIRADAGRLQTAPESERKALKAQATTQLEEALRVIYKKEPQDVDPDTAVSIIKANAPRANAADVIYRELRTAGYTVTKQDVQKVMDALITMRDLPAKYFEAKPFRAVGYDEVATVIAPDNIGQELRDAISNAGMTLQLYEAGNEDARLHELNNIADREAYFSMRRKLGEMSDRGLMAEVINQLNNDAAEEGGDAERMMVIATDRAKIAAYKAELHKYTELQKQLDEPRKIISEMHAKAEYMRSQAATSYEVDKMFNALETIDYARITAAENKIRTLEAMDRLNAYQQEQLQKAYATLDAIREKSGMTEEAFADWRGQRYAMDMSDDKLITKEERKKLNDARKKVKEISRELAAQDMVLLNLEGSEALRNIIERERERIAAEAEKNVDRTRETYANRLLRDKLKRRISRLDDMLRHPKDGDYIADKLRQPVLDFLMMMRDKTGQTAIEWRDDKEINARKAAAKQNALRIDRLIVEYQAIARENKRMEGEYDEGLVMDLTELRNTVQAKDFGYFNADELKLVNTVVEHIAWLINNEMDIFVGDRNVKISEIGNEIAAWGFDKVNRKRNRNGIAALAKGYITDEMSPIVFARNIGGPIQKLCQDLLDAESRCGIEAQKMREKILDIKRRYNWDKWDKKAHMELVLDNGGTIQLNYEEALMLYATYRRQMSNQRQNAHHLDVGGVVETHSDERLTKLADGITSGKKVTGDDIARVMEWLGEERIAYADEMVSMMSGSLATMLNETSIKLSGYSKFGEEFYFPYKVSQKHIAKTHGDVQKMLLKNWGAAKRTVADASKPVVLSEFTDTVAEHVEGALKYAYIAVPQDNLNRVMNYEYDQSNNVRTRLDDAYGEHVTKYIDTWIGDIYGNKDTPGDRLSNVAGKLASAMKRNAVVYSASVWTQQYSAIYRAWAEISPHHFYGLQIHNPAKSWAECKQYCGTAVIKEIGRFDTGIGKTMSDWLEDKKPDGWREQIFDKTSFMPEVMDKLGWVRIWEAVKREQAKRTGLNINSEELRVIAGRRFDEVVRLTQVYDSVFAKNAYLRSKKTWAQMLTAFGGEPARVVNMWIDAINSKKPTKILRTAASLFMSSVAKSLLLSFVRAYRDDDEEKTYWEKYIYHFFGNVVSDMNPLSYIPLLKDGWNAWIGYDTERMDMSVLSDGIVMVKTMFDDNKSMEEKLWAGAELMGLVTGIPVANIHRDFGGMFRQIFKDGDRPLREGALENAMKFGIAENSVIGTIMGIEDDKTWNLERMYQAILAGDEETAAEYREHILTFNDPKKKGDKQINSDLKQRIKEGYIEGDMTQDEAELMLVDYAGMNPDDAEEYINNARYTKDNDGAKLSELETYYLDGKVTAEEAKAIMIEYDDVEDPDKKIREWDCEKELDIKYEDLEGAYVNGEITEEQAVDARVNYGGQRRSEAEADVRRWDCEKELGIKYVDLEDAYVNGEITEEQAVDARINYGGQRRSEAEADVRRWDCEKELGIKYEDLEGAYVNGEITEEQAVDARANYGGQRRNEAEADVRRWNSEKYLYVKYEELDDAYIDGDITAKVATDALINYGGEDPDDAATTVKEWDYRKKHGHSYSEMGTAYVNGEISRNDAVVARINIGGRSREDAEADVRKWDCEKDLGIKYTELDDAYLDGDIAREKTKNAFINYGGMSEKDAEDRMRQLDYRKTTGGDYDALSTDYVNGNLTKTEAVNAIVNVEGATQSEAEAKVRKWDCEKELGIKYEDLDEAYADGVLTKTEAINARMNYGGQTRTEATAEVQKWTCAKETGIEYDDIDEAYLDGKITGGQAMRMLKAYGGLDDGDAKLAVAKWDYYKDTGHDYDDMKDEYLDGNMTRKKAGQYLMHYGGKTTEEAEAQLKMWDYEKKFHHPYAKMKDAYLSGEITWEQAVQARVDYGGVSRTTAERTVNKWKQNK